MSLHVIENLDAARQFFPRLIRALRGYRLIPLSGRQYEASQGCFVANDGLR